MVDWLFFVSGSWTLRFSYKSHEIHIGFLHFWTKTALSPRRRASDVHRLIAGAANPFARTAICCLGALPDFELPKLEVGSLKLEGPTSDFQLLTSKVGSWKSSCHRVTLAVLVCASQCWVWSPAHRSSCDHDRLIQGCNCGDDEGRSPTISFSNDSCNRIILWKAILAHGFRSKMKAHSSRFVRRL